MIVAQARAADDDTIAVVRRRIDHLEIAEDRMPAKVAQVVFLFAAKLLSQLDLPGLQRHALGALQR